MSWGPPARVHVFKVSQGAGYPRPRVTPRPVSPGVPSPRGPWRGRAPGPHRVPHRVAVPLRCCPSVGQVSPSRRGLRDLVNRFQMSIRLLRSTGIQAPGAGSTDPRGSDRPQSPSGPDPLAFGAADSARGRPPDPSLGAPDGAMSPGAALVAPVGPGRPGPTRCPPDGLGRRAVPAPVRPGSQAGAASQRLQALPAPCAATRRTSLRAHRMARCLQARPRLPRSVPAGRDRCGARLMASAAGQSLPWARPGSRAGAASQRLQALPSPGFELPESGGTEAPLESQLARKQDRMWQWIWADDGGVRSTLRVRPPS
ncbi:hypothetical protein NDU88_003419 [Pleurodeles waltl]|uniref:Translation initiation factor IF-2-like n=1 Tax=Pleurodeles waltl TaxID=8319 RepID=A0AAV7NGC9_PLEWA|nr:hypothetical protein NDU88_003419 [Pleurodeles waltl]